LGRSIKS